MRRRLLLVLILFSITGCADCADAISPSGVDMAAEFQALRAVQGHLDANWNDDVDEWMGRKHQLMVQLGSLLGTGEYDRAQIIQLLAPPDLIARAGDEFFELINNLPEFEKPNTGPYEFLIYHWREEHDVLYFTSQGDTVLNSGWWYAGE